MIHYSLSFWRTLIHVGPVAVRGLTPVPSKYTLDIHEPGPGPATQAQAGSNGCKELGLSLGLPQSPML